MLMKRKHQYTDVKISWEEIGGDFPAFTIEWFAGQGLSRNYINKFNSVNKLLCYLATRMAGIVQSAIKDQGNLLTKLRPNHG